MKEQIINHLSEGKTVIFRFEKGHTVTAEKLVDPLHDDKNYIIVQQGVSETIVNLLQVSSVRLS